MIYRAVTRKHRRRLCKDANTIVLSASSWTIPFSRHLKTRLAGVNIAIRLRSQRGVYPRVTFPQKQHDFSFLLRPLDFTLATATVLLDCLGRSPYSNDMCGEERYEPQVLALVHPPDWLAKLGGDVLCLQTTKTSESQYQDAVADRGVLVL
jgi:hypothetical protein